MVARFSPRSDVYRRTLPVRVMHYDYDFDAIAEITGQLCEWVVPRGSAP